MTKRLLAVGCAVIVPFVYSALGQPASPEDAAAPSAAAQPPSAPAPGSPQRVLLDRYCVACHSQRARAAGQDSAR
jgi:cytochrome c5